MVDISDTQFISDESMYDETIRTIGRVINWINSERNKFCADQRAAYKNLMRLCEVFHNTKYEEMNSYWDNASYGSMDEKISNIISYIYYFLGIDSADSLRYEYGDDFIYKLYMEFPEVFGGKDDTTRDDIQRSDYIMKAYNLACYETGDRISCEKPSISISLTKRKRDFEEGRFKIKHKFYPRINILTCKSRIAFYYPLDTHVTLIIKAKIKCNLEKGDGMINHQRSMKEEWLLRKVSFIKFIDTFHDSWWIGRITRKNPDGSSYLQTHWFDVYQDQKRNSIQLR
jgi:hypothetical protein